MNKISRILFLLLCSGLWYSCNDVEDEFDAPNAYHLLTSKKWISEKFINDGIEYDSIELVANVIDTVTGIPIAYPGDQFRAVVWMELLFTSDFLYFSERMNQSYLKCQDCKDFNPYYRNSERITGIYNLNENILETGLWKDGEWKFSEMFDIEIVNEDQIKIYKWIGIPLSGESSKIFVTHVNGVVSENKVYLFDVVFRSR